MVLYHCMIELKNDARALAFASAAENWLGHLKTKGLIGDWNLYRRKLGLGSEAHGDFMLQIQVKSLSHLDTAFQSLMQDDDTDPRNYELMHEMIGSVQTGLYRPYPDEKQRERIALI